MEEERRSGREKRRGRGVLHSQDILELIGKTPKTKPQSEKRKIEKREKEGRGRKEILASQATED